MRRLLRSFSLGLILALAVMVGLAEDLTVDAGDSFRGFETNEIRVTCPADGTVTVSVTAGEHCYRTMSGLEVKAGENTIAWDGLGPYEEPIPTGTYTMTVTYRGTQGATSTASVKLKSLTCHQALLYALPSSDTLYLEDEDTWLVQLELVKKGRVQLTVCPEGSDTPVMTRVWTVSKAGPVKLHWQGAFKGEKLTPGRYTFSWCAVGGESYVRSFPVEVRAGITPSIELRETGAVMPARGASDEQIWEVMQQPSAVILRGETYDQPVYSAPDKSSAKLGTFHGTSQCVQILSLETEGWALVGGWEHQTGCYIEGWLPTGLLKMVRPNGHYGILIDKKTQTMRIYEDGRVIGTMDISTGLATAKKMIRETPAGSFLTVSRIASFSSGGYTYEYPIRYDGGDLLHTVGYKKTRGVRTYSAHIAQLGRKASHGCVRIERFTEDGEIDAWWLYTHLPWYTRVIVMDDAEERAQQRAALGVTAADMDYTGPAPAEPASTDSAVIRDDEEDTVPEVTTEAEDDEEDTGSGMP